MNKGYKHPSKDASYHGKIHSRVIDAGETCAPGMDRHYQSEPVGPRQVGAKHITKEDLYAERPEHLAAPVGGDGGEIEHYDANAAT